MCPFLQAGQRGRTPQSSSKRWAAAPPGIACCGPAAHEGVAPPVRRRRRCQASRPDCCRAPRSHARVTRRERNAEDGQDERRRAGRCANQRTARTHDGGGPPTRAPDRFAHPTPIPAGPNDAPPRPGPAGRDAGATSPRPVREAEVASRPLARLPTGPPRRCARLDPRRRWRARPAGHVDPLGMISNVALRWREDRRRITLHPMTKGHSPSRFRAGVDR